jgi:hypothetical protein
MASGRMVNGEAEIFAPASRNPDERPDSGIL